MPLKLRFKGKARKYDVSSKNAYVVCVRLLENSLMECTLTSDSTGQECLENIAQRIDLARIDYFGLGYVNKKLQFRWLDLDRPIKKQLDKYSSSPLIYFGVMFYVPDIHKIPDSVTRYHFYLQLKSDVIEGKLPCTPEQSVLLAAYSVQAEFGDFDSMKHIIDFYKSYILLPKTLAVTEDVQHDLNQEICNQHRNLQGVSPQDCILQYILTAQQLEDCGCEYYPAKNENGKEMLLGVSFVGIFMKSSNHEPTEYFKWADISKVVHNKKAIGIETSLSPKTVHFHLEETETSKYVFKMCSLQNKFYHLMQGIEVTEEPPEDPPDRNVGYKGPPVNIGVSSELSENKSAKLQEENRPFTQFQSTDADTSNSSQQGYSSTMSNSYTDTTPYMSISDSPDNSQYINMENPQENIQEPDNQAAIQYMTDAYTAALTASDQEQQQAIGAAYNNSEGTGLGSNSRVFIESGASSSNVNQPYEHTELHEVPSDASTTISNGYIGNGQVQLPAYRAVPDYSTVMQQRMVVQQPQQNMDPVQANVLHSSGNLGASAGFSQQQPDGMTFTQPAEIVHTPPTYQQFLAQSQGSLITASAGLNHSRPPIVNANTGLQYSQSFLESHQVHTPGQYGKPVDRTSSLIIHPTYYRMTDTTHFPKPNNQFSTSEIMLREYVTSLRKRPLPYRLGSSSTPDLASQNAVLNLSSSPELVSQNYLGSGQNLMTQSQFDQSVENLALDTQRLQLYQQIAGKSKQHLVEEQSSSEQLAYSDSVNYNPQLIVQSQEGLNLNAQLHVQQGQDSSNVNQNHPHFVNDNLNTQGQAPTYTISQQAPAFISQRPQDGVSDEQEVFITDPPNLQNSQTPPHYHLMLAAQYSHTPNQMFYTGPPGNTVDLTNQTTQPNSNKIEHIYQNLPPKNLQSGYEHENPYENLPDAIAGMAQSDNPAMNVHSESNVAEKQSTAPHSQNSSIDSTHQESSMTKLVSPNATEHSKSPSVPSRENVPVSSSHNSPEKQRPQSESCQSTLQNDVNGISRHPNLTLSTSVPVDEDQLDTTPTDYEDSDSSPSGLKKAAMNGLSLSRADMIEMNDNDTRAPKDERRGALEYKLEEGQVFAEFEEIPKMKLKCETTAASQPDNKDRNRFKDVLPYDFNRVKLTPTKTNKTGYINASHVKLTVAKNEWWYIAAQGPKPETVVDFWQMVWEQDVQVLAMLTDLIEFGKQKCHRYWPEEKGPKNSIKYGEYVVTLKFTNDSGSFITRVLNLRHNKLKRERLVWHLQYTDWPDHACPEDTYGFLAYLDEIESVRRHRAIEKGEECKPPVLVHCSAGVGRSGVVILAEIMKACLEHNQDTEIATVLSQLRDQRMYLVQTVSQYSFVYKTLVTYLKSSRLI